MPSPSRTWRVALATTVALVALLAPTGGEAQGLEPSRLVGHWTCDGRLLSVELRKKHGALPIDLEIGPDLLLTGTVGGATIQPARGERNGPRVDFKALLSGQARPGPDFEKDHLVLLFTAADGATASLDFHLKTNFTFDLTMRQGVCELKRVK